MFRAYACPLLSAEKRPPRPQSLVTRLRQSFSESGIRLELCRNHSSMVSLAQLLIYLVLEVDQINAVSKLSVVA